MARKRKNSPAEKAEGKRARLIGQVRRRLDERAAGVAPPGARTAMTDEEGWRLDELREEARYRRERLELYRARMYGGRSGSESRLREYERAAEGASARLRRAENPGILG